MSDPTITCPNCKANIELTDSLATPLIESARSHLEQEFARKEHTVREREALLREQEHTLAKQKETVEDQIKQKVELERVKITADEAKKAQLAVAHELAERSDQLEYMQHALKQRDNKLAEATKLELDLLRKQRQLDDAIREEDVKLERRVQEALAKVGNKAREAAEEKFALKVLEKEQLISAMQKQIEDLKRKSEQGSQQLQGEAQEINLESTLKFTFVRDTIESVAKGESGGDIIQKVFDPSNGLCGTILWESKRTKNWSDAWLSKLRDDSRVVDADISIIVSQALPKNIDTFDCVDGVWVVAPKYVLPVAILLRKSLLEIAAARQSHLGRETKMEMIYQYLLGSRFRRRVEAIVEKFTDMQSDLGKERTVMQRIWAKREQQIVCVIEATAGMYGDLQGIAGRSLQEIEGLDVKSIEFAQDKHDLPASA